MEQPLLMPGASEDAVMFAEEQFATDVSMGFDGMMDYAYHGNTQGGYRSGIKEQYGDDFLSQYQPAVDADFGVKQSSDLIMPDEDFSELLRCVEQDGQGMDTGALQQHEFDSFMDQQPSFGLESLDELPILDLQPPNLDTPVPTESYSFNLPPTELNFTQASLNPDALEFDIASTDTFVTAPEPNPDPTPRTLPRSLPASLASMNPYINAPPKPTLNDAYLAFNHPLAALPFPTSFNQALQQPQQPLQPPEHKRLRFIPAISAHGALLRGDPLLCLPKPVRARIFRFLLEDYSSHSYIEMPDTKDLSYPYFVQYSDRWYSETCEILLSDSLWSLSNDASLFNLMTFLSEFEHEDGWTGYGTLARLEFSDAAVFRASQNGFESNGAALLRRCSGLRSVTITFALADLPFLRPLGTGLDVPALLSMFSLSVLAELPQLRKVEFKLSPYMAQHKALMTLEAERLGAEFRYKRKLPGLDELWGLKGWLQIAVWQRQGKEVEVQTPKVEEFVVIRKTEEMEGERKRIQNKGMIMGLGMGLGLDGGM